jgi:hypothetical protein
LSVERKICVSGHQELYAVAITVPGFWRSTVSPLKPKYVSASATGLMFVQVPVAVAYR